VSRNQEFGGGYNVTRLNYDPGEFTTDAPHDYVHRLQTAARDKDVNALHGVGRDMGMLAAFGTAHAYGPDGKPSTYTHKPTTRIFLPGGAGRRRELPQGASHGFTTWPVEDLDPRNVVSTQDGLQIGALEHYLSPSYRERGEVYDKSQGPANDHPVVLGFMRRNFLLTGHHRAAASLLSGEPLKARYRKIS
jgi:hypothetical protein